MARSDRGCLEAGSIRPVGSLGGADLQAPPPEEARIDRPQARPEEGEGNAQGAHHHAVPAILHVRERMPQRIQCQERTDDGGPQADDEERAEPQPQHVKQRSYETRRAAQGVESEDDSGNAGQQTEQQQPQPGRALGESGIEPAHSLVRL